MANMPPRLRVRRIGRLLLVVLAAGCARPAGSSTLRAPAPVPAPHDAAAIARAHEFFDAVDRRDVERFRALTGSGFLLVDEGRAIVAAALSRTWADRAAQPPPATRTCTDESIHRSAGALVYIGDCAEHIPSPGGRPAQDYRGWNTVVLSPDGASWKVTLWQWQPSGIEAERAHWNDVYRRGVGFEKQPNRLLVSAVKGVAQGKALDVAMGQGRNGLYLASQGWQVTGVDLSDEGIRAARADAAARNLTLDAIVADIDDYDFGAEKWDLVAMIYAGANPDWIQRIKRGMKPGGLFVLEHFLKDPKHPVGGGIGVEAGALARMFAGWDIVKDEVVEDVADWSESRSKLVRFVARKPPAGSRARDRRP
jgi:SAM-dependent methyltransferase